jgi:hypothetical protein
MSPSTTARRLPALAVVAGAHALALWWFLALTRMETIPGAPDASALVLLLLPEQGSQSVIAPPPERTRQPRPPALPLEPARPPGSAAPAPGAPSTAIDWAAEAAGAASRWVAQDEAKGRTARAFGVPPDSAMFAPAPARTPGLAWNHARAHRVEALPGGVTVFHINDHCAIAFLWIVPFFGCSLGKIPTRGDLFEHLHDAPDPPRPGPAR